MSSSLLDVLSSGGADRTRRIYGVSTAIVTNNQDPDDLGRVKMKYPWFSDQNESDWARIAAPMAGKDRGMFILPEVGDEVLVAFEMGDMRFPYVLGTLWNARDKPPEKNSDGKNNKRLLKSRTGHIIRLDDTDGDGKIEILDSSGKNSIVITTKDNKITIQADSDITIQSANGKLKIDAQGVEIVSKADVKIEATGDLNLKADGNTNVKGSTINLN